MKANGQERKKRRTIVVKTLHTKDWAMLTPLKLWDELGCSERISSSWCTTAVLAHIVLIFNIVIHFYPKDLQVHGAKKTSKLYTLLWPVVGHDRDCMLVILTSTYGINTYITTKATSLIPAPMTKCTQCNIV